MRVLAVDPGAKRVGLAVSDPTGTIAQPLTTIRAEPAETLAERLAAVARHEDAERIVVGLPRRLDGSLGPEAKAARELATELRRASGLPVELVDERLTTAAAEKSLLETGMRREKRRANIDRVAAAILLQSHLDRKRD
ncbi:MAG TPA: Holliday junction resolvase RuvX [Candidatus Dormibacteraeota bacterium]|nr:Holliday junction resolvase RuvX [Candidatus Dormibacteraeota bacterium]